MPVFGKKESIVHCSYIGIFLKCYNNMNNEIQRKITSLTLMTIMVAGGMTFAFPGFMPAAHAANANLFVSAENAALGNSFGGPMILEIIINDPDIKDTDEANGQPDVTIDGNDLIMAQGDDGSWYAYVAELTMAQATESIGSIDFGTVCDPDGVTLTDAEIYCGASVIKKEQDLNSNPLGNGNVDDALGQIGLINSDEWPFIQTFVFSDDSDIDVIYGAVNDQVVQLTYTTEMDKLASYSLDRTTYPHNADIHVLISDMQLNIDPTDEDIWIFDVETDSSYYGDTAVELTSAIQDTLSYGTNGFIVIDSNDIVLVADGTTTITFEETLPNSGIFENTNSADISDLITTDDASIRGSSGVIDYNDNSQSILVDYFNGLVTMDVTSIDDEWSSGEPMVVLIVDEDVNTNTKIDNDFAVNDATYLTIPAITIGSPITLTDDTEIIGTELLPIAEVKSFGIFTHDGTEIADGDGITIDGTEIYIAGANDTAAFTFLNTGNAAEDFAALLSEIIDNSLLVTIANSTDTTIDVEATAVGILGDTVTITSGIAIATSGPTLTGGADETYVVVGSTTLVKTVDSFSARAIVTVDEIIASPLIITYTKTIADLNEFISGAHVYSFIIYDISSLELTNPEIFIFDGADLVSIASGSSGYVELVPTDIAALNEGSDLSIYITTGDNNEIIEIGDHAMVMDFVRYAGEDGRTNDSIYRLEAEESSSNSGQYVGTVEYIMLNQINIFSADLFSGLDVISDELTVIAHEDLTVEDGIELIYVETDAVGSITIVSAKQDAQTHSGVVSFDSETYKVADTVTVTLDDADLNTDSDVRDIYTVIDEDIIGLSNNTASLLLDITFNDVLWETCTVDGVEQLGLSGYMTTIVETENDSGLFKTAFAIPDVYCVDIDADGIGTLESVTGNDIEVNYQDFRDASGGAIETGDSAGISANTGSVAFDKTVYPVPFGLKSEGESFFSLHTSFDNTEGDLDDALDVGDLIVHIRVNDPDFDVSPSGEDKIAVNADNGPVKITVSRGSDHVVLATAGASSVNSGKITIGEDVDHDTLELGPISEIAPDAGIFELDLTIRFTDGPAGSACPSLTDDGAQVLDDRMDVNAEEEEDYCILQGDILTVEYTDPTDASGSTNTVTDSATFDLRNGVLQSDKSVYIIGSDMILTLIEPDFDLDNDSAESYSLDLIEWDSDADTTTLGASSNFDPEPSSFRETGDSTGIFQVVIEIPAELNGDALSRGEEIVLEYTDWGPSGSNYVGDEDEDVNVTIYTSNFGATVELDQKVYTWTDKVYITIVAPDHNFDGDLIDEIGNEENDPIKVSTRGFDLDNYKLVETGTDTGIFTGEVILTGFTSHDADGDGNENDASGLTSPSTGGGPTNGLLSADDDDGLTVSFEFSEDETVVGSSLIRWNIGETQWLEASYPASGTGVVRIIDPDMNLNPEAVDNFDVDVWSDSDAGGIDLTVTETNEATGIFEGTVFFTTTDQSSGHRLRVAEGDTVTAEYEDNTLPDPYTTADELDVTATTLIGTIVPPLERAPIANLRTVDAFDNSLDAVSVDQQVQISADIANGQDRKQPFAYLVQIQDGNGVTVSLAWIADHNGLEPGQSFSPALSWIPTEAGTYTATAFVWESVDNPSALSPPLSITVNVR